MARTPNPCPCPGPRPPLKLFAAVPKLGAALLGLILFRVIGAGGLELKAPPHPQVTSRSTSSLTSSLTPGQDTNSTSTVSTQAAAAQSADGVAVAGCQFQSASIKCLGFYGTPSFVMQGTAGLAVNDKVSLQLENLQIALYGTGCAYSPSAVPLLDPSKKFLRFSASFTYQFLQTAGLVEDIGFSLLVGPTLGTKCGTDGVGYGKDVANSVAVVLKRTPVACVGLATGARWIGDHCQNTGAGARIPDSLAQPSTTYYAWISYSNQFKQLLLYISPTKTIPANPVLVANVNIPWRSVKVGFGGSATKVIPALVLNQIHEIPSFNFNGGGVLGRQYKSFSVTRFPQCSFSARAGVCPGYAGPSPPTLYGTATVSYPYSSVNLQPQSGIWSTYTGCYYSAAPVSLVGPATSPSFIAFFAFKLSYIQSNLVKVTPTGSSGFTFVVGPTLTGCGSNSVGYGAENGLSNSIGVAFKHFPTSCFGVVQSGQSIGVNCNGTIARKVMPQEFNPQTTYYAWLSYSGASRKLLVYLSSLKVKPTTPALAAVVSVPWTKAYFGFTGLGQAVVPWFQEQQIIYGVSIVGGRAT